MTNLLNNTTSLQEVLEALQNKAVGGASNPVLYGTYMLKGDPSGFPDTEILQDFSNDEIYAYFYNYSEWVYDKVGLIGNTPFQIGSVGYTSTEVIDGGWYCDGDTDFPFPDDRFLAIDFKQPVTVPQEFYDFFMSVVNNDDVPPVEVGYDIGRQEQYDEFWDNFQNYGNRPSYRYGFARTSYEYIRPKYKIVPTEGYGVSAMFEACKNLKKIEAEYFDFSQVEYKPYTAAGLYYTFSSCSNLEEIEDIGLPIPYSYEYSFAWCGKLHTIAKVNISESTLINHAFDSLSSLVNLTIEGTIGKNGLDLHWSTKLSKASITSVINALSTTTSGLSITLSKTAVNAAFPPPSGASLNLEWSQLINSRSNWTINLV